VSDRRGETDAGDDDPSRRDGGQDGGTIDRRGRGGQAPRVVAQATFFA
jgi:hypothetical protein